MNMHFWDWIILVGLFVLLLIIAGLSATLTRSVADFLAANRSAGRYLLTVAQGMSGLGAISIAANFEKYYQAGFGAMWWAQMLAPISLLLALSGFVVYRYRETRAMTMAQFFEMRYSRNFRVFAGILAWVSGMLNYGIFPAITARFLICFTGLPEKFSWAGYSMPTLVPVMILLLGTAVVMATVGGQISIMITEFFQGQFVTIAMLVILAVLFTSMSWQDVMEGLRHAPEGQSRINPFKQQNLEDFNLWFFVIMAFLQVYGYKAWQGSQGYNAAAKSPHEAKMAGILAEFRGMITLLVMLLIPIFIYAYLHLPQFAVNAASVSGSVSLLGDAQIQKQMQVPIALGSILPTGVMGLFAAVIIAASIATDTTYMHSWGSIFIQDVVLPFRKKHLSPQVHLWLLRGAICSVAAFGFLWSLIFPLKEYIFMYFQITGAIFLGGAGAVIIGGLYWPRGSTAGAWAAMLSGSVLAVAGIILRNIVWTTIIPPLRQSYPHWNIWPLLPDQFPLNGAQMSFAAAAIAIFAYVIVSLFHKQPPANMEKLLHRGRYAIAGEHHPGQQTTFSADQPLNGKPARSWTERLGLGPEFTRGDKLIYFLKIIWVMFFVAVFAVGTIANLLLPLPDWIWEKWWGFQVGLSVIVGVITILWFLIGGFRDLFAMVKALKQESIESSDDGLILPDENSPRRALKESGV